jgi:hypothetical protein
MLCTQNSINKDFPGTDKREIEDMFREKKVIQFSYSTSLYMKILKQDVNISWENTTEYFYDNLMQNLTLYENQN